MKQQNIPVLLKADVVVVGGGPAGKASFSWTALVRWQFYLEMAGNAHCLY